MAKKPEPLPPGTYTGKIEKVRKVRNKDAYRITFSIGDRKVVTTTGAVKK